MNILTMPELVLLLSLVCSGIIAAIIWNPSSPIIRELQLSKAELCNINTYEKEGEVGICSDCLERLGQTCAECDEEKFCKKCQGDEYTQVQNEQGWSLCVRC